MFFLYKTLLTLLYPLAYIYLLTTTKNPVALREKLAHYELPKDIRDKPVLWVHAVSVGEVVCATPFVKMWLQRHPDWRVVLSVTTVGGMDIAQKTFPDEVIKIHFPLDFPWVVGRALLEVRPKAFAIMETEIWPNIIMESRRHNVPVFLLNARVSDRMAAASSPVRAMYRKLFSQMTAIAPQSAADAERIIKLGAPKNKIVSIGNLKFDNISATEDAVDDPLQVILSPDRKQLFVAGSTHPGEEEQVLEAFRAIRKSLPDLRLILCPRHIERAKEVMQLVREDGWNAEFRSALKGENPPEVVVVDTIGELRRIYGFADACFVGGSLVERGGHNVLEPAAAGRAAFFGPYIANFRSAVDILDAGGGAVQIQNADDLARNIVKYLSDDELRKNLDGGALTAVRSNAGAAERACELIEKSVGISSNTK